VPASGACDVVGGSERADLLCYGSYPSTTASGEVSFGPAPAGYLVFLLVPAAATVFGGRRGGQRSGGQGWSAAGIGAAAGVVFAILIGTGCVLASVTLAYTAAGPSAIEGRLWIGPDPVRGVLLAAAWGVIGGAVGGASARFRSSTPAEPRR
jgi:hypothetical protein